MADDNDVALIPEGENDYKLVGASCWISVGPLSVYVQRGDEGVVVDIYPRNDEMDGPPLGGTWVLFNDARCPHCEEFCYQDEKEGCAGYREHGLGLTEPEPGDPAHA